MILNSTRFAWVALIGLSITSSFAAAPAFADEVTFKWLNEHVIVPKCVSCHSGSEPAKNIDLSNYDLIVLHPTSKVMVVAGRSADSRLYTKVLKGKMPPKDAGGPLSASDTQAIADWIDAGAKNN